LSKNLIAAIAGLLGIGLILSGEWSYAIVAFAASILAATHSHGAETQKINDSNQTMLKLTLLIIVVAALVLPMYNSMRVVQHGNDTITQLKEALDGR